MEKPPRYDKEFSIGEAISLVLALKQQETVKGAIDSEPEQFNKIIQEIESGALAPKEGIASAQRIADSRQDYH